MNMSLQDPPKRTSFFLSPMSIFSVIFTKGLAYTSPFGIVIFKIPFLRASESGKSAVVFVILS